MWHILRTRPNTEIKVETAVQQIGVQAYVPKLTIKRRHPFDKRQVITVRKALYPSYAFVSEFFPVEQITTTQLRAHWFMEGGQLGKISDDLMDEIEGGEVVGMAIEEVLDVLRCSSINRKLAKRARFVRLGEFQQGRAA